jgi:hypothetical protein
VLAAVRSNKENDLVTDTQCFLCGSKASIETVRDEGGQRFDVRCLAGCPQYEISDLAIVYLSKHPAHREGAIQSLKQIVASGKFPVVRVRGIPHQLWCTSREDEIDGVRLD